MSFPNLPRPPLKGDAGELTHSSPCGRFKIRRAFLLGFPAEAIINATNQQMILNTTVVPGGEFQINYAAGPQLKDHLNTHLSSHPHGLPVGEALTTPSFSMPSCHLLIHTSAPSYRTRTRENIILIRQQLADCYRRCLEEAYLHKASSVAFPCIGTGKMLGWPRAVASRIAVDTCRRWFGHPVSGERRRGVVNGTVSFLCDPAGLYAHQEDRWLVAFNEFFPVSETAKPPPMEEVTKLLGEGLQKRERQNRATAIDRGRGRRVGVTPVLKREDANLGGKFDLFAEANILSVTPKRKRTISQRELRDLTQNNDDETDSLENRRKRSKKPPRRYGQDE